MGISELRQHTEVYSKSSVVAARQEWVTGVESTVDVSILGGLRHGFAHRFDARFKILIEIITITHYCLRGFPVLFISYKQ